MRAKERHRRPISIGLLALFAGTVAICAAIATAPASIVPAIAKSGGVDLSLVGADGSLWRGHLRGVSIKGVRLGDIGFTLRPLSLLSGQLSFDLEAKKGALAGEGRASLAPGGVFSLATAKLLFDFSGAPAGYTVLGEPISGAVQAKIVKLVVGPKGCRKADAHVSTDILAAPARRFNVAAPALAGRAACEKGDLVLSLTGQSAEGRVGAELRVRPNLAYFFSADVSTSRPDIAAALHDFGFTTGGEGSLSFKSSGVIGLVAS